MRFKRFSIHIIFMCALNFFLISPAFSANYYVKNGGNDNANGLSDANAWATIAKVNNVAAAHGFHDGDTINFKRGSTWSNDQTLGKAGSIINWGTINGLTIQDYGSGALPRLDGNTQEPILIVASGISNLTIKNLDCSGQDWPTDYSYGNATIYYVNGLTVDGLYIDGHKGSSIYNNHPGALTIQTVGGNIEIKNCTIKNMFKDTFANTYSDWGSSDCPGIFFWNENGGKTSGTVNIHDNTITNIYSDAIGAEGLLTTTNIYNNTVSGFGEEFVDTKGSRYINVYNNDISWNNFGSTPGESYWGATVFAGTTSPVTGEQAIGYYTFHDNYVHDSALVCIRQAASVGLDVYNNYFKDVGLAYVADVGVRNQKFYNNVIVQTAPAGSSTAINSSTYKSGVAVRENTSGIEIYNNSFYISSSNHNYGIYLYNGAGAKVEKNIIQMTRNSSSVYPIYSAGTGPAISYNDYYNANQSNRAYENGRTYNSTQLSSWISAGHTGALFSNPMFSNVQAEDFSLSQASPCILSNMTLGALNLPLSVMNNTPANDSLAPPKGLTIVIGSN